MCERITGKIQNWSVTHTRETIKNYVIKVELCHFQLEYHNIFMKALRKSIKEKKVLRKKTFKMLVIPLTSPLRHFLSVLITPSAINCSPPLVECMAASYIRSH